MGRALVVPRPPDPSPSSTLEEEDRKELEEEESRLAPPPDLPKLSDLFFGEGESVKFMERRCNLGDE